MSTVVRERGATIKQGFPGDVRKEGRVYAIAFDMDIDQLRTNYGDPYNNAYLEIR